MQSLCFRNQREENHDDNLNRDETCVGYETSTGEESSCVVQSQTCIANSTSSNANSVCEFKADRNELDSTLQKQLYDTTKTLVKEGEKNVRLALEVDKHKDELLVLKNESETFRSTLLQGINGGITNSKNYAHVSLDELLRIRLQEASSGHDASNALVDSNNQFQLDELSRNGSSVGVIQKLEQKLGLEAQHNEALGAKCNSLKDELQATAKNMQGVDNLRIKVSQMTQRLRNERELRSKMQKDLMIETKKVEALSDHIEKLMVHLKHEAISKARSLSDQSRQHREMEMMKTHNDVMTKKNDRKDRVITELRDTGKLLEDQLRLMDEKYMELRSKLDWTRSQTERIVKKKEDEVRQLRAKFSLIADSIPGNSSKQVLLDDFNPSSLKAKKFKSKFGATRDKSEVDFASIVKNSKGGVT